MAAGDRLVPTPFFALQSWSTITMIITVALTLRHARLTISAQVHKLQVALPSDLASHLPEDLPSRIRVACLLCLLCLHH